MSLTTTKHFTLTEYNRLSELGFFSEDDRVELIRGQIIQMSAKGTAHEACNRRLLRELAKLLGDHATLQNQSPITLAPNSQPEPDFAIVQNRADDYLSGHPTPQDILLVIEIADSSLAYDQQTKLSLYAEAGIFQYWLFNLPENFLKVYSEPYQKPQGEFGYRLKRIVLPTETIALTAFPDLFLDLSKIFPV